ncbi:hypothetical protein FLJC2902T_13240 [Flavobacterium limnosediminis JC2902]|uniref:Uncharacterized protein n=1 Tax=Flavobacterium limnosediminis JC2902 TaxID=1341181 RepID=V6SWF2_9FLAO|nr:hypothetical protein FLJC2902T_13240 [Flavobacterium limnosediminis JC2902]
MVGVFIRGKLYYVKKDLAMSIVGKVDDRETPEGVFFYDGWNYVFIRIDVEGK